MSVKKPFLIFAALIVLSLASCRSDKDPAPTATQPPTATAVSPDQTATPSVPPDANPTAGATPTLPATSTPLPSPGATKTPFVDPTSGATSAPSPQPTEPRPPLTIEAFDVQADDGGTGKRLTFRWETTGADRVQIFAGTQQHVPPTWHGGPDGTLDAELTTSNYRDPPMTLVAYRAPDYLVTEEAVSATITIEWPCQHDYFFEPAPAACPVEAAVPTWAAEQQFQHGRMLWLEEVWMGDVVADNLIFVLYNDGQWKWYADNWTSEQPESDPSITPPDGLVQPIRGFGKVWRETPELRERLGWGLAPEQGHQSDWQVPFREEAPGMAYIRTFADGVVVLAGWDAGTWRFVVP